MNQDYEIVFEGTDLKTKQTIHGMLCFKGPRVSGYLDFRKAHGGPIKAFRGDEREIFPDARKAKAWVTRTK